MTRIGIIRIKWMGNTVTYGILSLFLHGFSSYCVQCGSWTVLKDIDDAKARGRKMDEMDTLVSGGGSVTPDSLSLSDHYVAA